MTGRPPPLLRALALAAALLAAPPWAAQAAVGDPAERLRDPAQEERSAAGRGGGRGGTPA